MQHIAIVHFQAIELYPPVLNDINYLKGKLADTRFTIFTTSNTSSVFRFEAGSANTTIHRFGNSTPGSFILLRFLTYFLFNISTLCALVIKRPAVVLYFETLSSFPAIVYKRWFNKKCKIMVHYHEYMSLKEYEEGMLLNKIFHKAETSSFHHYSWISHTNSDRVQLFLKDHPSAVPLTVHVLPNYPPRSWRIERQRFIEVPVKLVYVGALSLRTMYVRELAEWVIKQNGKVIWDIYTLNYDVPTLDFLRSLNCSFIQIKKGIRYFEMPTILGKYDVGVILYKGNILNYVYNAPNKLFEYLAADLDVWFPHVMTGSLPYARTSSYPKVIPLDFDSLETAKVESLINRSGISYHPTDYYCESVILTLFERVQNLVAEPT